MPALSPAQLPAGTAVGWYVDSNNLTHVLTRTPFQVALFKQGAWGDPNYTRPNGPALSTLTPFQAQPHPSDHTVLLTTRLTVHAQSRVSGTVTGPHGTSVLIRGGGSRFGSPLRAGSSSSSSRTGGSRARCRSASASTRAGYGAARTRSASSPSIPWGRHSRMTLRFRYP